MKETYISITRQIVYPDLILLGHAVLSRIMRGALRNPLEVGFCDRQTDAHLAPAHGEINWPEEERERECNEALSSLSEYVCREGKGYFKGCQKVSQ